ncbi:GGDEF domain-containing protein [Mycolicibacterium bacteremicum]|nr:GGDEF domain-containing protein [Mycolicibacterium bacteremicum]MCV7430667.1 GGDEF domain-containing protein [Mycolicibacterium bacteremicum]
MTALLRERRLLRSAQFIMVLIAASSALVPLSHLIIPRHLSPAALAVSVASVVFTIVMTTFWCRSWPTRRGSEAIALIGATFIAWWSLVQPAPGVGALACSALAVTGAYLAFLHSPRSLLINLALATVVAVIVARRLAAETDVATAVSAFWVIWFMNTTLPIAVRGMSRAMGIYATRADEDGLTGLLNRRAFEESVGRLRRADPRAGLAVLMVDIDDFKRINDTFGHAAGDRVILAVAAALREHTPDRSAICRAGGEEFLVAVAEPAAAQDVAAAVCAAVAGLPEQVTASIGIAETVTGDETLAHLIGGADAAMYLAKRSGGNTVR